jgi:hypothetical protein
MPQSHFKNILFAITGVWHELLVDDSLADKTRAPSPHVRTVKGLSNRGETEEKLVSCQQQEALACIFILVYGGRG